MIYGTKEIPDAFAEESEIAFKRQEMNFHTSIQTIDDHVSHGNRT